MTLDERLDGFVALSSTLTAFTPFHLYGTGQADAYLAAVSQIVGEEVVDELLAAHTRALDGAGSDEAALATVLRREILSDPKLGPLARNLIKLWYVGIWYELPRAWRDAFGAREGDVTFTISAGAYTEGLLWPAIGANPPGAKPPGYGSWAFPPRIPPESTW